MMVRPPPRPLLSYPLSPLFVALGLRVVQYLHCLLRQAIKRSPHSIALFPFPPCAQSGIPRHLHEAHDREHWRRGDSVRQGGRGGSFTGRGRWKGAEAVRQEEQGLFAANALCFFRPVHRHLHHRPSSPPPPVSLRTMMGSSNSASSSSTSSGEGVGGGDIPVGWMGDMGGMTGSSCSFSSERAERWSYLVTHVHTCVNRLFTEMAVTHPPRRTALGEGEEPALCANAQPGRL